MAVFFFLAFRGVARGDKLLFHPVAPVAQPALGSGTTRGRAEASGARPGGSSPRLAHDAQAGSGFTFCVNHRS